MSTDVATLAREERADLLEFLRGLSAEQWASPSLCEGWSVRDVAVHVVSYDDLSPAALVTSFLRGGLRPDAVNHHVLARYADLDPAGVVALHERHRRPRGLTAAMGCRIALTDGLIHQQDVRRALGLPRTIPTERLRAALAFSLRAPTLPSRSHRRGLTVTATDLGVSTGSGPEVAGPGEALLMGLAGRADALSELSGEGLVTLRRRVARS